MDFLCFVIENGSDGNVPRGLDEVDDIMSCVKKTKSGIYLGINKSFFRKQFIAAGQIYDYAS